VLYRFFHIILRFWMKIHFKRIFIQSLQEVPRKGAAILASNHPNSFLDAIVVALVLKRDIHFLVRSDVFRKPLAAAILKRLNMIPIYRLEEGAENLERNKGTFDRCNAILEKGGVILIFSEGNCVVEKRLRALRKGTARIWFAAMEKRNWDNPIPVIPAGVNYTHPYYFRGELLLNFGKACSFGDLKAIWENEPARAIRVFNEVLYEGMKSELLIIPDHSADEGAEVLLDFCRSEIRYPLLKSWYKEPHRFKQEKHFLDALFKHPSKDAFIQDAEQTGKAIRKMNIAIAHVGKQMPSWQTLFLMVGFIPATLSLFMHALPIWLTRRAVKKTKFHPKFRSSVMFGVSALSSYLIYLVLAVTLLFVDYRLLVLLIFIPRNTYMSLVWLDQLQLRRSRIQFALWNKEAPELVETIAMRRETLLLQSGMLGLTRKHNDVASKTD
jgi:1-acyl-sn-glycerol-3-phosphate acyltransferase